MKYKLEPDSGEKVMISLFAKYVVGYIQGFLMDNFDEAEPFGVREIVCMLKRGKYGKICN